MDPNSYESLIETSRGAVGEAMAFITSNAPGYRARTSPIATLLEPHADEIRSALRDGWTAGAIARMHHDRGMKFSTDSIRLRIAKKFGETAPSDRTKRRASAPPPKVERKPIVAPPSVTKQRPSTVHAGFLEDPR